MHITCKQTNCMKNSHNSKNLTFTFNHQKLCHFYFQQFDDTILFTLGFHHVCFHHISMGIGNVLQNNNLYQLYLQNESANEASYEYHGQPIRFVHLCFTLQLLQWLDHASLWQFPWASNSCECGLSWIIRDTWKFCEFSPWYILINKKIINFLRKNKKLTSGSMK
jgi:hypothetical protein